MKIASLGIFISTLLDLKLTNSWFGVFDLNCLPDLGILYISEIVGDDQIAAGGNFQNLQILSPAFLKTCRLVYLLMFSKTCGYVLYTTLQCFHNDRDVRYFLFGFDDFGPKFLQISGSCTMPSRRFCRRNMISSLHGEIFWNFWFRIDHLQLAPSNLRG